MEEGGERSEVQRDSCGRGLRNRGRTEVEGDNRRKRQYRQASLRLYNWLSFRLPTGSMRSLFQPPFESLRPHSSLIAASLWQRQVQVQVAS